MKKALDNEPKCPYYVIDEDGHGICKNHRYMDEQEPCDDAVSRQAVLEQIRAEIEELNNIDYVEPVTVDEILQIIDKHIKAVEE